MKMKELLHKRILVAQKSDNWRGDQVVVELKILEISPSGNWVKVMDMNGRKSWRNHSDIVPIEVLAHIEKSPSKK